MEQQEWEREAACRDLDINRWFSRDPDDLAYAKGVCAVCPVRVPCGDFALSSRLAQHGVWGGLDEDERRAMRRQAKGAA